METPTRMRDSSSPSSSAACSSWRCNARPPREFPPRLEGIDISIEPSWAYTLMPANGMPRRNSRSRSRVLDNAVNALLARVMPVPMGLISLARSTSSQSMPALVNSRASARPAIPAPG